jgi:hypothetical protein
MAVVPFRDLRTHGPGTAVSAPVPTGPGCCASELSARDLEVIVTAPLIVTARRTVAAGVLVAAVAGCAAGPARVAPAGRPEIAVQARTPQAAAQARRLPGASLGLMAGPWAGPAVRPSALLLGADWTVQRLRWTDWSRRHADGRGYYVACTGAHGPCDRFWAAIAASQVRDHDGRRYFAVMTITGRHQRIQWLTMNAKLGWWQRSGRP